MSESTIRHQLGIPDAAKRVLILSQSSHLDWDWTKTFDQYYQDSVQAIFQSATELMVKYHNSKIKYYYSIAEVGYLQKFYETDTSYQ